MSTDQFDPEQVVRIRMKVEDKEHYFWSERLERRLAEIDVALGPEHLAIEHTQGLQVLAAVIVPWTHH
jgi:hypothetical protein